MSSIYTEDDIKKFFETILSNNIAEAKSILKETHVASNNKEYGRFLAAKGILLMREGGITIDNVFQNKEKLNRLKKILLEKKHSPWIDEVEMSYFDTINKFINILIRQSTEATAKDSTETNITETLENTTDDTIGNTGDNSTQANTEYSIDQDPGKEKESDIAS